MYPTLTYFGNSSQWYLKKKTQQDKSLEIALLEERIQEKKQLSVQVNTTIMIRGEPYTPAKMYTQQHQQQQQQQQQQYEEEEEMIEDPRSFRSGEESEELHEEPSSFHYQEENDDDYMMIDPFQ